MAEKKNEITLVGSSSLVRTGNVIAITDKILGSGLEKSLWAWWENLDLQWKSRFIRELEGGKYDCDISGFDYVRIASLKDLQAIKIEDLQIIKSLTSLFIQGNKLNRIVDISPLYELKDLTELELNFHEFSDVTPLAGLKKLTKLNLCWNKINDLAPLSELKELTELWLSFNSITNIKPLSELKNLTSLYIVKNEITDIRPLLELKKLTQLSLKSEFITEEQMTELRNALPRCEMSLNEKSIFDL